MSIEAIRPLLYRTLAFIAIAVVIALVFQYFTPNYLSTRNISAIFKHMSVNAITAVGLTFVIVLRRFDLSLAGVASFSAMSLGFAIEQTNSLVASIAYCVAVGATCGVISGVLIGRLRMPDVVTTIAIGSIAFGMGFVYSGGRQFSRNFFSSGILDINDGHLAFLPMPVVIMLVTVIVAFVALHMSRFGQSFYAVGENPVSARLSGIPIRAYVITGFVICGALVGVSMILNVAALGAAYVNTGNRILLPSYTAVYLGAAMFGAPTVLASLAGALLMAMLLNGFTVVGIPFYYSDAVVSFILIAAIAIFSPQSLSWFAKSFRLVRSRTDLARGPD